MPRRQALEPLSPRALARLRAGPGSHVPTAHDLGAGPPGSAEGARPDDQRDGGQVGAKRRSGVRAPGLGVDAWADTEGDAGLARAASDAAWGRESVDAGNRRAPMDPASGAGPTGAGVGSRVTDGTPGRHLRVSPPRAWVRLPAAFVGARWQPGRAALVGVVIVAALAAAVFGLRVAWARSAGEGTVIAPGGGSRAGPSGVAAGAVPVGATPGADGSTPTALPSGSTSPGTTDTPGAAAVLVVVHVVGQVRRPGLQRLPPGSRVADAVTAAGGATAKADLSRLNLARLLVDGEQVRVPAPGDPVDPTAPAGPGGGGGTSTASGTGTSGARVSLNTADLAGLDTLPGVGPVLAQRILDWRAAHGRFASVDELGEVSGIGEKLLAQLSPLVTL